MSEKVQRARCGCNRVLAKDASITALYVYDAGTGRCTHRRSPVPGRLPPDLACSRRGTLLKLYAPWATDRGRRPARQGEHARFEEAPGAQRPAHCPHPSEPWARRCEVAKHTPVKCEVLPDDNFNNPKRSTDDLHHVTAHRAGAGRGATVIDSLALWRGRWKTG